MRKIGTAFLVASLISSWPCAIRGSEPSDHSQLVKKLGDPNFASRELATRILRALGEKALPALRQAASDANLETSKRAQRLIESILSDVSTSKSIGLEMVVIPAGEFQMGSPVAERGRQADEAQHDVRITKSFLLGKYEVTQDEFHQIMKTAPAWFAKEAPGAAKLKKVETNRFPVERVSWFDAAEFCNKLSERDGYPPYYKFANIKRENGSIKNAEVSVAGGNGYRLPTEAEWEYACRARTTSRFHFGTQLLNSYANAKGVVNTSYGLLSSGLGRTAKVGSYRPNDWGLHDMHGNVAEWCWDWYSRDYPGKAPVTDPHGPGAGVHRVMRGGSWLVSDASCRSASRFWHPPGEGAYFAGFRVARTP